jgi:hypothetical protein
MLNMRKFIVYSLSFIVLLLFTIYYLPSTSYAQTITSNPVTTLFGNAPEPVNQIGIQEILRWTVPISNALETGSLWNYYNRMQADISNNGYTATKRQGLNDGTTPTGLYWCTNLVIDSYNLAGKRGLVANHQAVVDMRKFWKTATGYKYVDYSGNKQQAIQAITPGYAIFFEQNDGVASGAEHVAILKSIEVDNRGNGQIQTYDSNSSVKISQYPIRNWNIENTRYPTRGFGGV